MVYIASEIGQLSLRALRASESSRASSDMVVEISRVSDSVVFTESIHLSAARCSFRISIEPSAYPSSQMKFSPPKRIES